MFVLCRSTRKPKKIDMLEGMHVIRLVFDVWDASESFSHYRKKISLPELFCLLEYDLKVFNIVSPKIVEFCLNSGLSPPKFGIVCFVSCFSSIFRYNLKF